jgi:hypothetical protein
VGGSADWRARSVSGREREGGSNGCQAPIWAGPGRKERGEREGKRASGPTGKMGQHAENEEERRKEKNFLFFLFSIVCKTFSSQILNSNSTLTKISHHINKYAAT